MSAGLNLDGLTVIDTLEEEHQTTFTLKIDNPKPLPHYCLFSVMSVKNGTKPEFFRDLNRNGKWVDLKVMRQRFRCPECKTITYADIPHMAEGRRMTERLAKSIVRVASLPERAFADVGREFGLSEGTVKNVWLVGVAKKLEEHIPETPRVLGIDEKRMMKSYCCVLGNVEKHTMLDLLPSRQKGPLHEYLEKMPDKHRVEIVCMDMWPPYREAARRFFPKAEIIADKFHVMKLASMAMDDLRKEIRAKLEKAPRLKMMRTRFTLYKRRATWNEKDKERFEYWKSEYPELVEAYNIKEAFCEIFDTATTRVGAQHEYYKWMNSIPDDFTKVFHPVTRAMNSWGNAAFAYIQYRFTSGYVESLNRQLGDMDRRGRGYSFEVLRAKALVAYGMEQAERPKFRRRRGPERPDGVMDFMTEGDVMETMQDTEPYYGIPLSTLEAALAAGWFDE